MTSARRGAVAVAATLAGVVVVLLFVALAARAGPSGIIHGTGHDGVFHAPSPPATAPPLHHGGHVHAGPPAHSPWWARALLIGLAAIACGFVLLGAVSAFGLLKLISLPGRRRATEQALEVEVDWLEDPVAAAEEIRRGSDLREQLLRTGPPRNAIVACWSRFEEQAAQVGLAPREWETPSEFTVRVLGALARDQDAVDRLERLYVEARFSRHEITEEHRERAIEAVRRVHASLLTAAPAKP
ncbi:DUF4129 domain-containing protein [Nocardioides cynanchi]|uniref:DUF4129 domain-containing protein n=1 Tax=Nocardioides cynanchi TaxID=2558918 RepID=UPI0012472687|nr:DUF4129 domain-containing protein [Nocardioides cynanchi]